MRFNNEFEKYAIQDKGISSIKLDSFYKLTTIQFSYKLTKSNTFFISLFR